MGKVVYDGARMFAATSTAPVIVWKPSAVGTTERPSGEIFRAPDFDLVREILRWEMRRLLLEKLRRPPRIAIECSS